MTRAEAIKIASKHNMAGEILLVDALVDLGVLKLGRPEVGFDIGFDPSVHYGEYLMKKSSHDELFKLELDAFAWRILGVAAR